MKEDVRDAIAAGLDFFEVNVVTCNEESQDGKHLPLMLQAAAAVNANFKVKMSVEDRTLVGQGVAACANYFNKYKNHPNILRHYDGRYVFGSFMVTAYDPGIWVGFFNAMGGTGKFWFAPMALDPEREKNLNFVLNGYSVWRGNHPGEWSYIRKIADYARSIGKGWVAPAWYVDIRTLDYATGKGFGFESQGFNNLMTSWSEAIATNSDYAVINTWNDWSENAMMPSSRMQCVPMDINSYYLTWYKRGCPPRITKDVIFGYHRVQRWDMPIVNGPLGKQTSPRIVNRALPNDDRFMALAFLTAPGSIQILNGSKIVATLNVGAGVQQLKADWFVGVPTFQIVRNGSVVAKATSHAASVSSAPFQDLWPRNTGSNRANSIGY